jgi:hypothetical protein
MKRRHMSTRTLKDISWYVDPKAKEQGEPGIYHSYVTSLATALNYVEADFDPTWLMGTSAFAFRIFINEIMCPSAMSIFDWSAILPQAIEQTGHDCIYVSRMWNEGDKEKEKKAEAHTAIVEGIDRGIPAVVWDVDDCEWGLIIGYDEKKRSYKTLTYRGKPSSLAFKKLGKNGIDVLSVTIPGKPNQRSREKIVLNSLKAAVAHAEQKEWTDRPRYQNGLAAYDLWALLYERWAMIVEAGKGNRIGDDILTHAAYYAGHHYSARCYARDYLEAIADGNEMLHQASLSYEKVASFLKPVWEHSSRKEKPKHAALLSLAQSIKSAKAAEEEGVENIREYLQRETHA